jgi:hypothetical protein
VKANLTFVKPLQSSILSRFGQASSTALVFMASDGHTIFRDLSCAPMIPSKNAKVIHVAPHHKPMESDGERRNLARNRFPGISSVSKLQIGATDLTAA